MRELAIGRGAAEVDAAQRLVDPPALIVDPAEIDGHAGEVDPFTAKIVLDVDDQRLHGRRRFAGTGAAAFLGEPPLGGSQVLFRKLHRTKSAVVPGDATNADWRTEQMMLRLVHSAKIFMPERQFHPFSGLVDFVE